MFKFYYIITYPLTLIALALILLYKATLSKLIGKNCNSIPTCSSFAFAVIKYYGAVWGCLLALKRLLRCHKIKGEYDLPQPNLLGNYKWKC